MVQLAFVFVLFISPKTYAQVAIGQDLVVDGGFESGLEKWPIWYGGTSTTSTEQPMDQTRMLSVLEPGGVAQILPIAPTEAGARYRLSGIGKVSKQGENGSYGVHFKDASSRVIVSQWIGVVKTEGSARSIDLKIPYGTTHLEFWVYFNKGSSPLFVDRFQFVKLPN